MNKKSKKGNVFNLTVEEKDRLAATRNVSSYILDLIKGDMDSYVSGAIKTRLSLGKEVNVSVDIEKGVLSVVSVVEDKEF